MFEVVRRTPTRKTPIKVNYETKNININAPLDIDNLMQPNARSGLGTPMNESRTPDIVFKHRSGSKSPLIVPGKRKKILISDSNSTRF